MSKKTKSGTAAEEIADHKYLLLEIFMYLPVLSLVRFRQVSKEWSRLISDRKFTEEHTLRHSIVPSGLFLIYNSRLCSQQNEWPVPLIPMAKIPPAIHTYRRPGDEFPLRVLQSCNGLYLFCLVSFSDLCVLKIYRLQNPTTGEHKLIPLRNSSPSQRIIGCSLAFDPLRSKHYKIVRVDEVAHDLFHFVVYSSETDDWKATNVIFNKPPGVEFDKGVYSNGGIHWITDNGHVRIECYRFDLQAETLTILSMPPKPRGGEIRYFGEYTGYLHLVYVRSPAAKRFQVFEMDGVTLEWSVRYRVHLTRIISPFPEVSFMDRNKGSGLQETHYAFSILCIVRGENEADSALVLMIPGKVISYNFFSRKIEVLSELHSQFTDTSFFRCVSAYPFVPTLYRLNHEHVQDAEN